MESGKLGHAYTKIGMESALEKDRERDRKRDRERDRETERERERETETRSCFHEKGEGKCLKLVAGQKCVRRRMDGRK